MLEEFQRRVLRRACGRTLVVTRRAVREAVVVLDSEGYLRRRKQAACLQDVWIYHEPDGMSTLMARLATEQAIAVMTQVNAAAHACEEPGLIGVKRADALAALVLGGGAGTATAARGQMSAHVNVTMDLPTFLGLQDTFLGLRDGVADLAGVGAIPADVVRDLLTDPDVAVTIRRLVTDPVTGHLLDYGRKTYAVPQALREFIIARDRTCRFPGCNRRADLSQIDHAIAWDDGGQTNPANLGPLCTRHHQLKTHGGWHITTSRPDGSCTWISPQGRVYDHHPPPHEEAA